MTSPDNNTLESTAEYRGRIVLAGAESLPIGEDLKDDPVSIEHSPSTLPKASFREFDQEPERPSRERSQIEIPFQDEHPPAEDV